MQDNSTMENKCEKTTNWKEMPLFFSSALEKESYEYKSKESDTLRILSH
jgi:hypothetical protein